MEIFGAAMATAGLVQGIFKSYSAILRGTDSRGNAILLTRLRLERARFETTVQLLSQLDTADSRTPELQEIAMTLMVAIAKSLARAEDMLRRSEEYSSRVKLVVKWHLSEKEKLQEVIRRVSDLNDDLLRVVQMDQTLVRDQIATSIEASTGGSANLISERTEADRKEAPAQENIIKYTRPEQPSGQLLERLVRFCAELLTLFSNEQPEYAEISNQFQLWRLAVESEGLYHAMDSETRDSKKIQHRDLIRLLFRSAIRIGKVLSRFQPSIILCSCPSSSYDTDSVVGA